MLNLVTGPVHQSDYYSEYLTQVDRYKNQSRKSVFVRYYNVDKQILNDSTTKSTLLASDRNYQIYEYTPVLELDQITDTVQDSDGKYKFAAESSISIYTIAYPSIHDIVMFAYPPYNSAHAFRVKGISASLREKDAGIHSYKLDLEYANDVDYIESLKITGHNVYSMFDEKYIRLETYTQIMKERSLIQSSLDSMQTLFNPFYEMYGVGTSFDVYNNSQLLSFSNSSKHQHYFNWSIPFGAGAYGSAVAGTFVNLGTNVSTIGTAPVTVVPANILDYNYNPDTAVVDLPILFSRFSG